MAVSVDRVIVTRSEAETAWLGEAIAVHARRGDVVALLGDIGAGKTVFARAFIRALTNPDEEVPSPTFTLLQTYDGPDCPIYHFDLYRIADADEALELGIEDAFANGISLIEWPERIDAVRDDTRLTIHIGADGRNPSDRVITVQPGATWIDRLASLPELPPASQSAMPNER